MKNLSLSLSSIIICSLLLSACEKTDYETNVELSPKPETLSAYLNVNFNDSTYHLVNGLDGTTSALSYIGPAKGFDGEDIFGAQLKNDSTIIEFNIGFTHISSSRNELLSTLIKAEQELSYGYYDEGALKILNYGFLVNIIELAYPLGPGKGYSTYEIEQPESSYFRIGHYYAGETKNTIWLEGSFKLEMKYRYTNKEIIGDFFMEFPVCCFK